MQKTLHKYHILDVRMIKFLIESFESVVFLLQSANKGK